MKRLVVVGAGAVGGCISVLVSKSAFPVTLVTRANQIAKYQDGLTIQFPGHSIKAKPELAAGIQGVDWRSGDVVIVATKLNDAPAIFDQIVATAGRDVPVVCASNGVAGERWANERFINVIGMMIWMPSTHMEDGDFRVYGKTCPGVLDIGPLKGCSSLESKALATVLRAAGFESEHRIDIMKWKHAKWITNLGNTAQALISDDWKRVAKLASEEGERVFTAANIDRIPTSELLDRCKNIALAPIDGQRRDGGSTWQSFQRGKPLETPWIEGGIVALADSCGADAPVNKRLNELAKNPKHMAAEEFLQGIS